MDRNTTTPELALIHASGIAHAFVGVCIEQHMRGADPLPLPSNAEGWTRRMDTIAATSAHPLHRIGRATRIALLRADLVRAEHGIHESIARIATTWGV